MPVLLAGLALPPLTSAAFPGPNGKIAYTRVQDGHDSIYVMHRDGSHKKRLAPGIGPSFSPNGKKLVFSRRRHHSYRQDIWTMRADGSHQKRLTHTTNDDAGASFSANGRKILFNRAFFSSGDPSATALYTIRADGSPAERLPHTWNHLQAKYSPHGRHIVSVIHGRITIMRADGSNQRTVDDPGASNFDGAPDFSPSGERIVFDRDYNAGPLIFGQIYVVRTDGTHLRRIDNSPAHDYAPVFSPEGGKIAFESDRRRAAGSFEIYAMKADGSDVRRLTHAFPRSSAYWPSWGVRP